MGGSIKGHLRVLTERSPKGGRAPVGPGISRFGVLALMAVVALLSMACDEDQAAAATPTPAFDSPSAAEVLSISRESMDGVNTLHLDLVQRVHRGGVAIVPFTLSADMELPESFHGIVESGGNSQEFLTLGDDEYAAQEYQRTFQLEGFRGSQRPGSNLVKAILSSVRGEGASGDYERVQDEVIDGVGFCSLVFQGEMAESLVGDGILGDLSELGSVEVLGEGKLLIDRETLLPHRLTPSCEDCYLPFMVFGSEWSVTVESTLSGFDEPVDMPGPEDEPTLLPEMTPMPTPAFPEPRPVPTRPPPVTATPTPAVAQVDPDPTEFEQAALARHLTVQGAVMYGTYDCPACEAQRDTFGEGFEFVEYVECGERGVDAEPVLCQQKGITAYPTWEIDGVLYLGARFLDELAELSGYGPLGAIPSTNASLQLRRLTR